VNLENIQARLAARAPGQEVVVVLGLGFVGTAVVANLSRARGPSGALLFHVIGLDRDDASGREKVARLDRGVPPTYANDPSLEAVVRAAGLEQKNCAGSTDPRVLALADVVVSCINLDLVREGGQTERLHVPTESYADAMRMVGRHVRAGTLVCVESTLPVGTCDQLLLPALAEGQREQGIDTARHPPLLAYCYERVMPGPDYLDSVNNFWRAFAGTSPAAADKAEAFLAKYVNVAKFPLHRHKHTRAAEMAKLLENSYRATNIAFIEEWSRLAEQAGVDLFDIIRSVKMRKGTHDNMMLPGLGVGGYCLTKDAMLAAWGAEHLLGARAELPFSRLAILTNERMPLRALELVRQHYGEGLAGKRAVLFGVTYRAGVADTRSSPSEIVARALARQGVQVQAYDPLVERWEEYPECPVLSDPRAAARGAEIAVVCLPDPHFRSFLPELLVEVMPRGGIVVDPWNMVAEAAGQRLAGSGVRLEVFGRGDLPPIGAKHAGGAAHGASGATGAPARARP
jgi:nucleotide sugar dehydrogenase